MKLEEPGVLAGFSHGHRRSMMAVYMCSFLAQVSMEVPVQLPLMARPIGWCLSLPFSTSLLLVFLSQFENQFQHSCQSQFPTNGLWPANCLAAFSPACLIKSSLTNHCAVACHAKTKQNSVSLFGGCVGPLCFVFASIQGEWS